MRHFIDSYTRVIQIVRLIRTRRCRWTRWGITAGFWWKPHTYDDLQERAEQGIYVELENSNSENEEPKKLATDFLSKNLVTVTEIVDQIVAKTSWLRSPATDICLTRKKKATNDPDDLS